MIKTSIVSASPSDSDFDKKISTAADIIKKGGLVVFPTETVYGLGADATNPEAAKKIYTAKGRPSDNPLIIHISEPREADKYTETNKMYYKLAERFMPGPLTVVLKAKSTVPSETRAGLSTVAVRCPENEIARALIKASGVPIAAPSANLSGSPSPTTAGHVIDDMLGRVDMIIDGGECDFGLESTIVKIDDEDTLTLLRPGKVTVSELEKTASSVKIADAVTGKLKEGEKALSPGMKYRHYAPASPLELLDGEKPNIVKYITNDNVSGCAIVVYEEDLEYFKAELPNADLYSFGKRNDEMMQAHCLFAILRDIDKKNYTKIYAPLPSKNGVGLAIYNRLIRAAAHKIVKL